MPKSSPIELADLREAAMVRDGWQCRWPGCYRVHSNTLDPLEMAHLEHRGMGGSRERNTLDNVIILCRYHHALFDGRTHDGLHRELAALLRTLI
jgi:predicted restriction endonuclease